MLLEKILESPLDCKDIQPVHPKGDQSWVFIGRTDAEAETPILWPPDVKSWLIWKDLDARKDWRQEEKGTTEDEMVGWHHRLNGHGFGWTTGVGGGWGGLACCGPWSHKESDRTERLNRTDTFYVMKPTEFLNDFPTDDRIPISSTGLLMTVCRTEPHPVGPGGPLLWPAEARSLWRGHCFSGWVQEEPQKRKLGLSLLPCWASPLSA